MWHVLKWNNIKNCIYIYIYIYIYILYVCTYIIHIYCIQLQSYTTAVLKFWVSKIFGVFKRRRLQLFDQKYSFCTKYNLIYLNNAINSKMSKQNFFAALLQSLVSIIIFKYADMVLTKHSYKYQCWKQSCCLIFLWKTMMHFLRKFKRTFQIETFLTINIFAVTFWLI